MIPWLYWYLAAGTAVFLLLAYVIDSEPLPARWWRDWSFVAVFLFCVLLWPLVLLLWVRKRHR